jgi:hypothetical protein
VIGEALAELRKRQRYGDLKFLVSADDGDDGDHGDVGDLF